VLFILNRFFREMSTAIAATHGHYSQFTGDGLMALYGLDAADPSTGPASGCPAPAKCWRASISSTTSSGTNCPRRCGSGSAFTMARPLSARWGRRDRKSSPPSATVNTCARLESLTKEFDCLAVISRRAAEVAGLDVAGRELHHASVKGRTEPVQFYALKTMADLPTSSRAR
jgi:adenylate cyclase